MELIKKDLIFKDVKSLKGVGSKISTYLKNKKIEKIKDILFDFPYSETDRSKVYKLNELEIRKNSNNTSFSKETIFPKKKKFTK